MYKEILVAVDGSDPALRALQHASIIAGKFNSNITIVTAYYISSITLFKLFNDDENDEFTLDETLYEEYSEHIKEAHSKVLSNAVNYVKKNHPKVKVTGKIVEGKPAVVIKNIATDVKVDLIVMGNRGVGGIKGWLLGSTSKEVVDTCKRPVLIVK